MSEEYAAIYLAPPCFGDERYWCQDDTPVDCDCPNGPHPWKKFVNATELSTLRAENELLREQGGFLLDRLDEFLPELTEGPAAREFYGHVAPAASRFRNALAQVAK